MEKDSKLLTGKTAVVTGALSGIGRATAEVFARNGANVFACAEKRNDTFLADMEKLAEDSGIEIIPIIFDMTKNEEIKAAAQEIRSHKKNIDALINVAGIARDALLRMVTGEDITLTFQINFFAQIKFTQYIANLMGRGGNPGSVVFTSSYAAAIGDSGQTAYAASKAALLGSLRPLSNELGKKNIRVNAVKPGVIDTKINEPVPSNIIAGRLKRIALGRIGTAEEVANLNLFLASDLSSHITGQAIRIDGGMGL